MKKYWKFTAIIAVIVLSIGTFYVNSAISADQNPEFVIKKESGDTKELEPLVLEGSYQGASSGKYISRGLELTGQGTEYRNPSFLNRLIGSPAPVIERLQEQYRGFMRGKSPSEHLFFENDRFLAYANVDYEIGFNSRETKDHTFEIDILNKKEDSIDSFAIIVPGANRMDHMFVDDVQIINGELNIITQNMVRDNNRDRLYSEKHIYTIDMANQKFIKHEPIIKEPKGQDNTHFDIKFIEAEGSTNMHEKLLFLTTEREVIKDRESTRLGETSREVISYNLITKEKRKLSEDLNLEENEISAFDGSAIYLTKVNGQKLMVTPFHLEKKKRGDSYLFQLSDKPMNEVPPLIKIKDGKLYAASNRMNSNTTASVIVADLKTGDSLFKGELSIKDSEDEIEDYDLYIHDIFVK
ncbi:hypothetical protein GWK91_16500 [Virgibacillus sp. MSP4-1]|uniref:hypothetical protein n=1 Tax=Virgibacillus sp. MSP4-1 TaxID=2700081 RepID=UPI00039B1743|nr:hypothetical protein [Virgibacillus sp. MSP4-1]QHS24379.1 hypothetical protein GWK91_16500 [Virgibacillus sp. MSP4-1]